MHIKFLDHGTGSGIEAVRYLLQKLDHRGVERAGVRIIDGDPDLVAGLIDSLNFVRRYRSVVIAFSIEDEPTDEQIMAFLEDFKRIAFAGLDLDEYEWIVVEHIDEDGVPHLHGIVANVHLPTGLALNIAPPGWASVYDALRDAWNYECNWARPDDPVRAKEFQEKTDSPKNRAANKSNAKESSRGVLVTRHLMGLLRKRTIQSREDVVKELAAMGEVTQISDKGITVCLMNEVRPFFLKGTLYDSRFNAEEILAREQRQSRGGYRGCGVDRQQALVTAGLARERVNGFIQRRKKSNEEKYHNTRRARITDTDETEKIADAGRRFEVFSTSDRSTGSNRAAANRPDDDVRAGAAEEIGGSDRVHEINSNRSEALYRSVEELSREIEGRASWIDQSIGALVEAARKSGESTNRAVAESGEFIAQLEAERERVATEGHTSDQTSPDNTVTPEDAAAVIETRRIIAKLEKLLDLSRRAGLDLPYWPHTPALSALMDEMKPEVRPAKIQAFLAAFSEKLEFDPRADLFVQLQVIASRKGQIQALLETWYEELRLLLGEDPDPAPGEGGPKG